MAVYILPRYQDTRRADLPAVMLESSVASTIHLQRQGVSLESRDWAPRHSEGSLYRTSQGDRVRLEQRIVTEEGVQEVVREALDVGQASPKFIDTAQRENFEPSDAEIAQGEIQRQEHLGYVSAANASANYTEAYVPPSESTVEYSFANEPVFSFQGGASESAPVYRPSGSSQTTLSQPDTPVFEQPEAPAEQPQQQQDYSQALQEEQALYGINPDDYGYLYGPVAYTGGGGEFFL